MTRLYGWLKSFKATAPSKPDEVTKYQVQFDLSVVDGNALLELLNQPLVIDVDPGERPLLPLEDAIREAIERR